ncbi:hypothetical protein N0V83_000027 [Neocucurbitaria cava]|uniref:Heterokaryon incompatibility domain-containing protein n=1 Tax=Neocucurbitaria cava TaxID=798079 RepID=A0A9W8YFX4_9PLEO|nr:hypothetical protein N0V83_000027 [Neocucurbitaria cava]
MENLRTRQDGISLGSLPKTFKEAIICCRKLGLPYLWIDSLCIVQDDKDDWERESGHMDSIYYNSTLTLAATNSPDSSGGLFIPRRPHDYPYGDIVTLPTSFGGHNGQAYVTTSTWGVYGPPASDLANGILRSRGWIMQEKYLARRTLHFLAGQMVWECCERIIGQSDFNESFKNNFHTSPRREMKAFAKGFMGSHTFREYGFDDGSFDEESKDDEDGTLGGEQDYRPSEGKDFKELDDDEAPESPGFFTSLHASEHGRASSIIDLRDLQYQTSAPPALVTRKIDNELYNFLDVATRHTIYHVWYSVVEQYSTRELTFESDKLPALAGIASRVRAITHDQYLAGHWRRELERSLFWHMETEPNTGTPARVKKYRAPSWSWASVNGLTSFSFADLAEYCDKPASIEVLEASTQVEGGNPFGCVSSAKLIIKASILEATWNAQVKGWILSGNFVDPLDANSTNTPRGNLRFFNGNGSTMQHVAGFWDYDDNLNGILPGPPLTPTDSWDSVIVPRLVPGYGFLSTPGLNRRVHGKEFMETPLWKRGTYVPEDLVLVKGPVRKTGVHVLVLAKADGEGGEGVYRRLGMGQLGSWDEAVESVEILTVV